MAKQIKKPNYLVAWEGDDAKEFQDLERAKAFILKDLIQDGGCDRPQMIKVYKVEKVGKLGIEIKFNI